MQFQAFSEPEKPFIIGLAPVTADAFLLLDEERHAFRTQKEALYVQAYDDVCRAKPDTLDGQISAASLITNCLKQQYPDLLEITPATITDKTSGVTQNLPEQGPSPLADVALLLQDDLLLMRRYEDGWRLVAASLCFPSSWNLHEKFDKPLETIHGPVPMDEKMHQRIRRIFDAMRLEVPLWRENWGITNDQSLRHVRRESDRVSTREDVESDLHLRVEYQTLHKLPQRGDGSSGDILFTVGVRVRSMAQLATTKQGMKTLETLTDHYEKMMASQRDYKGLGDDPRALIARLREYHASGRVA